MKTCSRCKEQKPISEFNKKRASGVQPYCRPCQRDYQRENYENTRLSTLSSVYESRKKRKKIIRLFLADYYSTHPCVDCGETDIIVLDFDHLLEKNFGINKAISNVMPIERIEEELKNGEVRCSNCHRKITAERTRNWRWRHQTGLSIDELDYTEEL
jgi:transcription elongation factor Elf1